MPVVARLRPADRLCCIDEAEFLCFDEILDGPQVPCDVLRIHWRPSELHGSRQRWADAELDQPLAGVVLVNASVEHCAVLEIVVLLVLVDVCVARYRLSQVPARGASGLQLLEIWDR